MRFLLDENVSLSVQSVLRELGYVCCCVKSTISEGASDQQVFEYCCKNEYILITRDYHFTNPIRFPTEQTAGIIFIRHGNLTSKNEADLISNMMQNFSPDMINGRLLIVSPRKITRR